MEDMREPSWMAPPVIASHPAEGQYRELHHPGLEHTPHSHIIKDDWLFDLKQRAGSHIDRHHTPRKEP